MKGSWICPVICRYPQIITYTVPSVMTAGSNAEAIRVVLVLM